MKCELRKFRNLIVILALAMVLSIAIIFVLSTQYAYAESDLEKDYVFETVPAESIVIAVESGLTEIQPREEFNFSYEINPWYTTASEIYFDVTPNSAAIVTEVSKVQLVDGRAQGTASITVSADAVVGSTFTVFAGVDGIESNSIEITIAKIPVKNIALSLHGSDDKLHIGKTRTVDCEFSPSYASVQDLRYELSGSGMKYIEDFDEISGTITAKKNIAFIDVNSTVTITAYSIDNPNAFDSVTLTLYMPTTTVEIMAETPLGCFNSEGNSLAVASSFAGDTVSLNAKVNGIDSTGLNYVIVKGQEYVEDGYVHSDGTFVLRSTTKWSENMKIPHPEIKIRAAYSDGFDEITVSVYVPIEKISFVNPVVNKVENFRSYDMCAEAFPKYATLLADNDEPIYYSLNGIDSAIAYIDNNGLLSLPKSLTSKGSIIKFSANLTNAWEGVDVQPLTQDLTIMPVYAESFKSIKLTKNGVTIDGEEVKALPSDTLTVEVVYTVDNVTDINVSLSEDSDMISTLGNSINISALNDMHEDNPFIEITVNYDHGGSIFSQNCYLSIYVPALSAEIANSTFHRDRTLNLNELIKINGHGHATNKDVAWGTPTILNSNGGMEASCENGMLRISSQANAGTIVRVSYKTYDSETWQFKEFSVAALDKAFTLEYGKILSNKDNRIFDINYGAPQLEEGQSIEMYLRYNRKGGKSNFGLTYSIEVSSNNATLVYKGGNEDSDIFVLGAKSGQSGNNNYITYKITIYDGTETYYVFTDGASVSGSLVNGIRFEKIAIFKRISGTLGVSDNSVEIGYSFNLTGWNSSFTFNQNDLSWSLPYGTMEGNKITSAPDSGFILTITAYQKYNGENIIYSSQIPFSSIIYKYENSDSNIVIAKKVYKKPESSIALEGKICTRGRHIHTGWSDNNNGSKNYVFGETFSSSQDKELYAYWVKTSMTVSIEQEITVDENQNNNSYTEYMIAIFSINELKELGYKRFRFYFEYDLQKIKQDGDCAKIWVELEGKEVYVFDRFSVSSTRTTYRSCFYVDMDKMPDILKIRVGLSAHGDWRIGKYTFTFYKAVISIAANEENR